MGVVLKNKIIILQGKLRPDEEVRLIEISMTLIGNIAGFQGVDDNDHITEILAAICGCE